MVASLKHKAMTKGHHQEWSLRLNSIQHEKTHQVQTWHLVVCFLLARCHPYSFLCGPVLLSARVACHQRREAHLEPGNSPRVVDAFLFSAIWHALGGKRGLERPRLDVAVTALAGGELTVGEEFWGAVRRNGVTSDAFLEALVACKDRVCGPEFRWLPQAPPQSVAGAHALLLNSVAGIWASRGGPKPPTVSCLSTPRMHNRRRW